MNIFERLDSFLWTFPALLLIVGLGAYLTLASRCVQIRRFPSILRHFYSLLRMREESDGRGIHPLKAFFAAIGGAIGIGNIIVICIAVQLGGPGALFWVWVTGFFAMMLKYSEVFIGIRHRVANHSGSYDGGPMYFLQRAFPKARWVAGIVCLLLCIYGVEILIFSEMVTSLSVNWHLPRWGIIVALLLMILWAAGGGIRRVGQVCSMVIPLFVLIFVGMSLWVLSLNWELLPSLFATVFRSAFTGHAAIGGFAGSTVLMTIVQGAARGCYSGDVGIGYASVVHSETALERPQLQAGLAILGIFLDTFIVCSMSLFLILITDVWMEPMDPGLLVQTALSRYFPYMNLFMPFLIFLLGYSTMTTIFCVGLKSAQFLAPTWGRKIYWLYALITLPLFSSVNPKTALLVMSLSGALLLIINLVGIFRLRKELDFDI
jgi:alanine or glycine:cation symporter, AGCS family